MYALYDWKAVTVFDETDSLETIRTRKRHGFLLNRNGNEGVREDEITLQSQERIG